VFSGDSHGKNLPWGRVHTQFGFGGEGAEGLAVAAVLTAVTLALARIFLARRARESYAITSGQIPEQCQGRLNLPPISKTAHYHFPGGVLTNVVLS